MKAVLRVVDLIDAFTKWVGWFFAFLVVPLMGGLVYEVFSRYVFHAPTIWAYDLTYMLYGSLFMLGAAYTLYRGGHIRTDFLYRSWSARQQGLADALLYLLFYFPGMIFFLIAGWDYAHRSWITAETAAASPWRPPVYPFKTVLPVTAILLLVQGVSELLKSIYAAVQGEWPPEHHETEAAV
jgi:TRAP-type mannitol/chloroaromatic compound transport system permease small subunit